MKAGLMVGLFAGLLAVGPAAVAEECCADGMKKEDVKTWIATADGEDYAVRPATPTYFGDTGLFHVSSAYTLPRGKFAISLFRDNLDRDPADIDFSIHGLNVAYGVTSRLEVFTQLGLQNRVDTDAPFQMGFFNDLPMAGAAGGDATWETGFGDIWVGAKYGFLSDHGRGDPLGLAVKASIKIPTASFDNGLGTGKVSTEAHLILSKSLGTIADVHGSIGYQINGDPANVNIANALILGTGINIPACRIFQVQADLRYTRYGKADYDQTNPVDLVVGPVVWIKPGFFIRPALSWNLAFDDHGMNQGMVSSAGRQIEIGYHPGTVCQKIAVPPPPPPPPANRAPTVRCDVDKSTVAIGESAHCRASASDPDGDPLTYEWTASAGEVTGAGDEATWDSTGVPGGTSVTVTVRVSDGRGGHAESTCTIRVEAPAKAPEPVRCSSGGFPINGSRLNNVDKACLDDVASRLRQDPRARVVIIGHADVKEKYPEIVGRKRAEAAKLYLVKERGVDESRIGVRSAAARRPADTANSDAARKANRRVEVVFLAEGVELAE